MDYIYMRLLFALLLSFLFTLYLVPIFIAIARKFNIMDYPNNTVKKHKEPTPYLGGAAIYLGFLMTLAVVFPFDNQFFQFLLGSSLLFYIGLIDDLFPLRPAQKFTGQAIVVLCFLRAGFYLKAHIFSNIWNIPISALWMLTIINAFNLIDIMDGLAATVALWSGVGFLLIALWFGEYLVAMFTLAFIGSIFAFLRFNYPPAQLYMGDAGSLFIGGFFATMPFLFNWGSYNRYGFLVPVIVLAVPLLEITGLILIRSYKKIPFYNASPDHFAMYLKKNGFSDKNTLYFVSVAAVIPIICSILFLQGHIELATLFFFGLLYGISWLYCVFFHKI